MQCNETGQKAALKVLERAERYERFKREVAIASALEHPNILPILDYNFPDDPVKEPPFFVTPWCSGGTLAERWGKFESPRHLTQTLLPIASAVCYLHNRRDAHRDIKPPNILFDADHNPILADFGLAYLHDADFSLTGSDEITGSMGYLAPEYLHGSANDHFLGDAYSFGRTIWAAAAGEKPLPGANLVFPQYNLMLRRGTEWQPVVRLIQLLTYDTPMQRLTMVECLEELQSISEDVKPVFDGSQADVLSAMAEQISLTNSSLAEAERDKQEREEFEKAVRESVQKKIFPVVGKNPTRQALSGDRHFSRLFTLQGSGQLAQSPYRFHIVFKSKHLIGIPEMRVEWMIALTPTKDLHVFSQIVCGAELSHQREFTAPFTPRLEANIRGLVQSHENLFYDEVIKRIAPHVNFVDQFDS